MEVSNIPRTMEDFECLATLLGWISAARDCLRLQLRHIKVRQKDAKTFFPQDDQVKKIYYETLSVSDMLLSRLATCLSDAFRETLKRETIIFHRKSVLCDSDRQMLELDYQPSLSEGDLEKVAIFERARDGLIEVCSRLSL
jgi:hypothetical protein